MKTTFLIFVFIYLILIGVALYFANQKNKNTFSSIRLFDKSVLSTIGFLTYAATLFSTFTLLGLPNFFRTHGVGAWVFLGITDTALVAFLIWIGLEIRNNLKDYDFKNITSLLKFKYKSDIPKYVFLTTIFIFLMPYVAIQIRGVIDFMQNLIPIGNNLWGWGILFTGIVIGYSIIGGLRAIIYSDVFQAILLLIVTYIIAFNCIEQSGGLSNMFSTIEKINPELLTTPGPKNLFSTQFLLLSFVTIILMTISQPQLFTRIMIIKSNQEFKKMCLWLGLFALIIITPTVFIGLYGSINYYDLKPNEFWTKVFIDDQSVLVGGLLMLGLLSAAMSTADSQLFAIESEFDNPNTDKITWVNKIPIVFFGAICLLLAIINPYQDELVKFATLSFQGTSLAAPMIVVGIFKKRPNKFISPVTAICVLFFALSIFGIIPASYFGIHIVLLMLILISIISTIPNSNSND